MKKISFSLVICIFAFSFGYSQTPIATLSTSYPTGSDMMFYIGTTTDGQTINIDWGDGTQKPYTVGTSPAMIYDKNTGSTIKIFGAGISYLYVSGNRLTSFSISSTSSIEKLFVAYNQLTSLDLSGNTAIKELYCNNNLLTSLNLNNCSALEKISFTTNKLTSIDLSTNVNIINISGGSNLLTTLNLTNNTKLNDLYCTENQLTSITFPTSTELSEIRCQNNLITSINLSGLPNLWIINIDNNKLTSLDVSNKTILQFIYCRNNLIQDINVTGCTSLGTLECAGNKLLFTTLPVGKPEWGTYNYNPQAKFPLPKKDYAINESIDLSSQLTANSVNTIYTWKTKGGQTLTSGVNYTASNGVFTFLSGNSDSLYCEMTNTTLPALTLNTTAIAVPLPAPLVIMTTTTAIGSTFSFTIRATTNDTPVQVDWGDGTVTNHNVITSNTLISGTLKSNTIKLYGANINYIDLQSRNLTSIDVTNNTVLQYLFLMYNQLASIDVTKNIALVRLNINENVIPSIDLTKNVALLYLECYKNSLSNLDLTQNILLKEVYCGTNQLTTIDLSKNVSLNRFDCWKNNITSLNLETNTALTILDISYNQFTSIDISKNTALESLYCGDNKLSSLDLSYNTALKGLSFSRNNLTTIDLSKNTLLTSLSCQNNQLTALDVSKNTALTYLNCVANKLTFSTLPIKQPSWTTYNYSMQAYLTLPKNKYALGEEIDLSNQLIAGGNTTIYVWRTPDFVTLTKDVDYTENNGKFTFIKELGDYLYCQMTNASFPDFSLSTEKISISSSSPNITLITTSNIGNTMYFQMMATISNATIQVDWGDGVLVDYIIGSNTYYYISKAITGNNIKIYGVGISYFSINNGYNIVSLDVSKATTLNSLYLGGNKISILDVSTLTKLITLDCKYNRITSLDLNNCTSLRYIDCSSNKLTFTSLPLIKAEWITYTYSPQLKLPLPKKNYTLNEEIDLSSQLTINSVTTNYKWKTKSGVTLTAGTDYTESNGKFNFLNAVNDSIYCEMTNAIFPNLTLNSTAIELPQEPILTMNTTTTIGSSFSFIIRASEENIPVKVNWGDGTITNHNVFTSNSTINGTIKSNTIRVYGSKIIYIDVISKNLTSIDISNNKPLKYFFCKGNQLTTLDVTKNTELINLDCSSNLLTTLDVTKNTALVKLSPYSNSLNGLDVSKNLVLSELNCSYNENIKTLDISKNIKLEYLYCAINGLTAIDVSNNPALIKLVCRDNNISSLNLNNNTKITNLGCDNNKLTTLDVSNIAALTYFDCHGNKLNTLDVSMNNALVNLYCESNHFIFSSLPIKKQSWANYTYSPQAKMVLQKKNYTISETIDLSNQFTTNGNTTSYTWKTMGGTTLYSGIDYITTNGVTTFLKTKTDSVYCQMTNATFPGLTLTTTNVKITQFPTSVDETHLSINTYPNPIKDILNIELNENIAKVEVYTILGAKIFEKQGDNTLTMIIPAADFPKGLLIVKVYGRNGIMDRKVIKE
ncbi:MAG: T9SS type A sorting domain-containing protein [Tenuifilaceae bacterium]